MNHFFAVMYLIGIGIFVLSIVLDAYMEIKHDRELSPKTASRLFALTVAMLFCGLFSILTTV